jgi:hypothetical protein
VTWLEPDGADRAHPVQSLTPASEALVSALAVERAGRLGGALHSRPGSKPACATCRVCDMPRVQATVDQNRLTLADRIEGGFASVREIVGKV